jgi:hypothetical protein
MRTLCEHFDQYLQDNWIGTSHKPMSAPAVVAAQARDERAFYAGAWVVLNVLYEAATDASDEDAAERFRKLREECVAFQERARARVMAS